MSGYTVGPWTYGVRHDGSKWLSIGDYKTGPHYQGDLYASEADAILICAAPLLLSALIAITNSGPDAIPIKEAFEMAHRAIERATS